MGIGTGVWTEAYLAAVPLLMVQFAFFCSVSIFLAVLSRGARLFASSARCCFGWFAPRSTPLGSSWLFDPMPALARWRAEIAYWVLPKPVDFNLMMSHALHADNYFTPWPVGKTFEARAWPIHCSRSSRHLHLPASSSSSQPWM